VDVEADTGERRQKAGAVLIRFFSWTRLLGASVSSLRMGWNLDSVKYSGSNRKRNLLYLQSFVWVWRSERSAPRLNPGATLAQFEEIGLKSQSEGPVLQAVARSGTTEWRPYRN
jgi:hypothetical protein